MSKKRVCQKLLTGLTVGMLILQSWPVAAFGSTNDLWAGLKTKVGSIYNKAVYTVKNPGAVTQKTTSNISKLTDMTAKNFMTKLNNEKKRMSDNYQSLKKGINLGSLQLTSTLTAPLKNYLTVKRNFYTANMSPNGINQSQLAELRNDSSLKAINLTDEEWLSLATFAYANIMNETESNTIHRANLDKMANNTKLANLTLVDYEDKNGKDGFVGYAFRAANNSTLFAFRGSEGSRASEGKGKSDASGTSAGSQQSKGGLTQMLSGLTQKLSGITQGIKGAIQMADEFTTEDWIDSYQTGFRSKSKQFDSVQQFVEKNRDSGQIYVTGHSKGATNAAYACAAFGNCSGVAFDGIGIGHTLTDDQKLNLTNTAFLNFANDQDPLSAFLFHNEKRGFYQGKPVYVPTIDKNGKLTKELVKGPIAGHYGRQRILIRTVI